MVSLKKSLFFASLQTALNALSLSFSFFKNVCNWIDKKLRYFLRILFLSLPFASFSQLFIYTFNIEIATLQYLWNLSYIFLAEQVAVYAIIIDSYPGAQLRKLRKRLASPRETEIFSNASPGAERCLYTYPWTGQKKSWLSRALRWAHPRGGRGHGDNADHWLCVSLSNKAQFSMHLEVREFWSSKRWVIFARYFGLQHKPSMGIKKNKKTPEKWM